ncbi:MAG: AI-2E family transporter [Microcystaceae cyanobacterium]
MLIGYLQPLFSILITATLFSFVLDFPIRLLQNRGMPRGWAVAEILILALIIVSLLGFILIPLIVQQLSDLVASLPEWFASGSEQFQNMQKWAITQKFPPGLHEVFTQTAAKFSNTLEVLTSNLLNFVLGAIGSIFNIFLELVLTIFLVIYGERAWNGVFSWLPSPWNKRLRKSIKQTFESYFAGQSILAAIVGIAQIVVFVFLGVPYAVLFGFSIGVTTLIPYASAFTIILVSLLVALQNFGLGLKVLIAAIAIVQINDNFIAPRLMGKMIGINPVWLILSLFIGGKLGGILGLLLAVPVASVIKNTAETLRNSYSRSNHQVLLVTDVTFPNPDKNSEL